MYATFLPEVNDIYYVHKSKSPAIFLDNKITISFLFFVADTVSSQTHTALHILVQPVHNS